jgi:hypothetical protein
VKGEEEEMTSASEINGTTKRIVPFPFGIAPEVTGGLCLASFSIPAKTSSPPKLLSSSVSVGVISC